MGEASLNSFEKLVQSKINKIKPRSKQRGYARDLIDKLYPTIESALEKGCSYEEIVDAVSDRVKISPITLKQYHQANKRKIQSDSDTVSVSNQDLLTSPEAEMPKKLEPQTKKAKRKQTNPSQRNDSNKSRVTSASQKIESVVKKEEKPRQTKPYLTGASLTDEDYLDDFNDY